MLIENKILVIEAQFIFIRLISIRIVTNITPIDIPKHLQHRGKQNLPICGARSGLQLHKGILPNFSKMKFSDIKICIIK